MYSSFLNQNPQYYRPGHVNETLDRLRLQHPQHDVHHNTPVENHERIKRHADYLQKKRQLDNCSDNAKIKGQSELISFLHNFDRSVALSDVERVVNTMEVTLSEFKRMTQQQLNNRFLFIEMTPEQRSMMLKANKKAASSLLFTPGQLGAQSTPNPYFV